MPGRLLKGYTGVCSAVPEQWVKFHVIALSSFVFLESQANDEGDAVEIFGVPDGLEDAS